MGPAPLIVAQPAQPVATLLSCACLIETAIPF